MHPRPLVLALALSSLQLHCCEVCHSAFACCCDFLPTNVRIKACSLKLILNSFSHH